MTMAHLALLGLLSVTALVYAPVRTADFVYEDQKTEGTRTPLVDGDDWQQMFRGRPRALPNLTMRVQATGDATVREYHLFNLGVHLVNGGLLYVLAAGMVSPVAAWLATAVWLLHPIQVESVAYVSGRPDLLVVTCVLLMLLASRLQDWRGIALVTACGVAAMLAKESGIVVIGLLPLWLVWRRHWSRRWLIPIGAWVLGGGYTAMGLFRGGSIDGVRVWHAMSLYTVPAAHGSFWFAAVQAAAVWRLLALVVVPVGFTVDHDWDLVTPTLALVALVALAMTLILTYRTRARWPAVTFAAWWVPLALAPRFVLPLPDYVNEHHVPLALLGPCLGFWSLVARRLP